MNVMNLLVIHLVTRVIVHVICVWNECGKAGQHVIITSRITIIGDMIRYE